MGCSKVLRNCSNLQCFLHKTTPFVASQSLPKTSIRDSSSLWQPIGKEVVEFFSLGDLWDQYYEWSAYGLGVPFRDERGETVVQYYVPHLSAIQIYTSKCLVSLRSSGEESESDSWSDDSESEKLSKSWDATSEDSTIELDRSWPAKDRIGQLYFQYVEYRLPHERVPLVNKVSELAQTHPSLTSLKSFELSPASWMSISWYPIYHIPARKNVKELSASFLTYHTISAFFQDETLPEDYMDAEIENVSKKEIKRLSLSPFGLAAYKMNGNLDFWLNPETEDQDQFMDLYSAAYSWLKQLKVQHPDFDFFATHSAAM